MEDFTSKLTHLMYTLYAIRVDKGDGKEAVRIYNLKGKQLSVIVEFYMDELAAKITRVKRSGIELTVRDIQELIDLIKEKYPAMDIIPHIGDVLGWQRDTNGHIKGYVGSEVVDAQGEEAVTDPEKRLLGQKGTLEGWGKGVERFTKDNILLQVLLLLSMSSIVTALLGLQTLIAAIIGKAREGKTTASGFMLSVFASPLDERLSLNFNATDNYLMARMNGNIGGGCVAIDDGSLNSRKRNFQDIIYSLASNMAIGRLVKNKCSEVATWCTSVVLTGEQSFLFNGSGHKHFNADLEGFAARVFEVMINPDSLFNSAGAANEMQEFIRNQHGTAGMAIVKYILQNGLTEDLEALYKTELKRIRAKVEADPVMQSISENIAVICVTAQVAGKALKMEFDIKGVEDYMINLSRENLQEYREMKNNNETITTVYPILVKLGTTVYKEYSKDGDICIPVPDFKKHMEDMHYEPGVVKKDLFNADLLVRQVGYTYTIGYKGEPVKVVRIKNTSTNKNEGEAV